MVADWLHARVPRALLHMGLVGIATGLLLGIAGPARAEMRALLVGVSGYAQRPLQGPRNDVRRMRELLEQRSFKAAQITTLADGVAGAGEPTRAAIFAALDVLAARSGSGDTVFLYFAGHGSQQPADPATPQGRAEADGLHETFLPLDVGRWDGKAGTVHNAIIDFELRDKVDRILARGAFVWAVFDACHSASLVRAAGGDDVRRRQVDPRELGVPADRLDRVRGAAAAPALPGHFNPSADAVYFYATQTTEATIEMKLPPGEAQQEHQGFFSFVLRRALAAGRPMSYRQLGQVILAQYGALNQTDATPLFAGNALDRLVFGQDSATVRQWPIARDRMAVPVGTLSGLTDGARFALMPDAAADAGQAIGLLRAVRVGLNQADLEPVAGPGRPAPGPASIGPGAQARLLGAPERYTLRVAIDERACREGCRWRPALEALRAQGAPGVDLQWVADSGDLTLQVGELELMALAPGEPAQPACGPRKPRCASPPRGAVLLSGADGDDPVRLARRLAERLHAISRANNLMRLAARAAVPDGPGVEVRVALQAPGAAARREASAETVARAVAGDRLVVSLHNRGKRPADVTVLYLDANHGISLLYPSRAGDVNRFEPDARHEIPDITLNDDHGVFGLERLLVIAVEAERQADRMDFSFLTQPPLLASRARDAPMDDDIRAFFDAAFPDARQRDTPPRLPGWRTRMMAFAIDLAPARPAPAR